MDRFLTNTRTFLRLDGDRGEKERAPQGSPTLTMNTTDSTPSRHRRKSSAGKSGANSPRGGSGEVGMGSFVKTEPTVSYFVLFQLSQRPGIASSGGTRVFSIQGVHAMDCSPRLLEELHLKELLQHKIDGGHLHPGGSVVLLNSVFSHDGVSLSFLLNLSQS